MGLRIFCENATHVFSNFLAYNKDFSYEYITVYLHIISKYYYVQSTCSSRVCKESNHREKLTTKCAVYIDYCTRKL